MWVVIMGDYLEGYVRALHDVLDEMDRPPDECQTISEVRRMLRQMIDETGSE